MKFDGYDIFSQKIVILAKVNTHRHTFENCMQNACRHFQESVNFVKGVNNCFIKACNFEWVFHLKNTVKFDCQFKDG